MGLLTSFRRHLMCRRQLGKKLIVTFCALVFFVYSISNFFAQSSYLCEFIKMDYFHRDLDQYFPKVDKVDCFKWTPLVYFDNTGKLQQNLTEVNRLGYKNLACRYRRVLQTGPTTHSIEGDYSIQDPVNSDVVHVTCKDNSGDIVYSDVLYHVNWNKTAFDKLKEESSTHLSAMLFGIDSLSALLAERTLPKTLKYVRETLGGVEMKHYNKIGLNTRPNLLAALAGMSFFEAIIPTFKYPELFQKLLDEHYITCKGEDYLMPLGPMGFKYPIYHHDVRKYFEAFAKLDIFLKVKGETKKPSDDALCKGNKLKHEILIDFNKECFIKYRNKRKLVFSWIVDISHDDSSQLQLADDDILEHFKWLKDSGILNNTVLIFFGDHGPGLDPFGRTDIGIYTHRLPFFSIVLPSSMKLSKSALQNLQTNKNRLTTPYDFHETLKDLLFSNVRTTLREGHSLPRGISLFTEIPRSRTCAQANIPENYCPCYSLEKIDLKQKLSNLIGNFLVDELNSILKNSNLTNYCQLWHNPKIISMYKLKMPEAFFERYMVNIQVNPQKAEYMASVDVYRQELKLVNTIDRTNKYGDNPSCLHKIGLFESYKPYCFCF